MILSFLAGFGISLVLSILFHKDIADDVLKIRMFLRDAEIRLKSAASKDEKFLRREVVDLHTEIRKLL